MDCFQPKLTARSTEFLDTSVCMTPEERKPALIECTRRIWKHLNSNGLKIKETWKVFENFVKDVGLAPKENSRLRITKKSSSGPISEDNCRWDSLK